MTRAEQHLVLEFFRRRKLANWAKLVARNLHLRSGPAARRAADAHAPDGKPWKLRLLVTDRAPDSPAGQARRACPSPRTRWSWLAAARGHRAAG